MTFKTSHLHKAILGGTAATAMAVALASAPALAIVPNNNQTPTQIIDNAGGVNGVGMFFRNDGFVCTGTLINPRTVLFAAHCVNDRLATDYSSIDGTVPAAFSFNVDARPGFQNWAANAFRSNSALNVFNISQIQYDPRSLLNPQALGFLEADIALATLDTPAARIPTWALLFSPLPTPTTIDPARGTGYHVTITGYGRSGNGTAGATQGVDFRRRAAENMLGALASLDDRNDFLFGPAAPGTPPLGQNLYNLDFDDPRRGTAGANQFDINIHRDDALPGEGTTAGGDSGGPLILTASRNTLSTKNLQIGVLSGGSRFFGPQAFSSYGTTSFYQPLYLYWDYIAATNPYRYVTAAAGNGNWEDASRWVTTLDPNYNIINASGQVVNGIPTGLGLGIAGGDPDFGQVCIQGLGLNECRDLATRRDFTPPARTTDGAAVVSGIGRADLNGQLSGGAEQVALNTTVGTEAAAATPAAAATATEAAPAAAVTTLTRADMINSLSTGDNAVAGLQNQLATADLGTPLSAAASAESLAALQKLAEEAQRNGSGIFRTGPLPTATLANGLPGATNFVPNNINPNNRTGVAGRYFDVTLSAAGTTTLSSVVTIDRLTVANTAGLTIAAAGNLSSLIDVTQTGGTVNVNGRLRSVGDYTLAAGLLTGTGTIQAPFVTSIMGTIAPGGVGSIGTLTIDGSAVLSSATQFAVDVGNGVSDRLAITGAASLGGRVIVSPVSGYTIKNGDTYRIVTTGGAITAAFNSAAPISAILTPVLTTSANAVDMRITAGLYRNVIASGSAVQRSYAGILDSNRSAERTFADVYLRTDLMSAAQIQATFEQLAPFTESARLNIGEAMLSASSRFHRTRMQSALSGNMGGTIAMIGQPMGIAATATNGMALPGAMAAAAAAQDGQEAAVTDSTSLDSSFALYLGGGYINGKSTAMPTALTTGRRDFFDGYFITGGFEYLPRDGVVLGISGSYSDVDANVVRGQSVAGELLEGSIYGAVTTPGGLIVDGRISAGRFSVDTARSVLVGPTVFNLGTSDDSLALTAELGLSKAYETKTIVFTPRIAAQYQYINYGDVREIGGGPALDIDRDKFDSLQIRVGASASAKKTAVFRPYIYADYVYDVLEGDRFFGANFAGSTTGRFPFAYRSDDRTWAEAGVGLTISQPTFDFTASIDTTVGRQDFQAQQYSLSALVRF
ncbi:autotransporter domain-containing protein [Sphingomonas ursincola]|uniref:autotransporter domain-containing protein n=1 Tax=Sphingomonas ursincola TaxID=56361 RepID=UPI0023537A6F|nr:autotransporter domain-containing protein [Sphingomonas ursincola]MBY0618726.1 autotransporter domain-containing protein [Sphingomonas ursincola]